MKKNLIKIVKFLIFLSFFLVVFILNIWLINQGSGFTVPRELLFRSQAEILKPIIAFPIVLIMLLLINKNFSSIFKKIKKRKKLILTFVFCLFSAFSLLWTVQTNPDYGRYQYEAKYLVNNGIINFFKEWGNFYCDIDMPVLPFIYGTSFKIFDEGQRAVLFVNFLIFLGILWFIYLITKKFFNRETALISIILFSTTPYIITQTHLFLVDLGQTFFLVFSFYLIIDLIEKPSLLKSSFLGLILFITSLTKIYSILFLIIFFIISLVFLIFKKKRESFFVLIFSWAVMIVFDLIYVYWKRGVFYNLIFHYASIERIIKLLVFPFFWGFLLIFLIILSKILLSKIKINKKRVDRIQLLFVVFIYSIITLLFLFGGRKAFYLKTPLIATNIPMAILFYSSIYIAIRK